MDYGFALTGNRKIFTEKWGGRDVAQRYGKKPIIEMPSPGPAIFAPGDLENAAASMLEAIRQTPMTGICT